MGYSPWGHKELDTAEHICTHKHVLDTQDYCYCFSNTSGNISSAIIIHLRIVISAHQAQH